MYLLHSRTLILGCLLTLMMMLNNYETFVSESTYKSRITLESSNDDRKKIIRNEKKEVIDENKDGFDQDGQYKQLPFCTDSFFDLVENGFVVAGTSETTAEQAKLLVEVVCVCDIPADVTDDTDPGVFWGDLIKNHQSRNLCESVLTDLADIVDAFDVCGVDQGDLQSLLKKCPDYLNNLIPPALYPHINVVSNTNTDCLETGDLVEFYNLCDGTCITDLVHFLDTVVGVDIVSKFKTLICDSSISSSSSSIMSSSSTQNDDITMSYSYVEIPDPTMFPVLSPTMEPSFHPTRTPLSSPTMVPVASPTIIPFPSPTMVPVSAPTYTHKPTTTTHTPTMFPVPYPTIVPVPSPTLPAPTQVPVPAPTPSPTPPPTSVDTTTIAVAIVLVASAPPTDDDKSTLKGDIVTQIGLAESDIRNFEVTYVARRRQLLTGTWDVTFDVVASLSEVGEADAASFQADIESELTDSTFQASVVSSIAAVDSFESVTSVVQTRNPSSVPVPAPTGYPTMPPIPVPTPQPTSQPAPTSSHITPFIIVIALSVSTCIVVVTYLYCKCLQEKKTEIDFGLNNEEINTFNVPEAQKKTPHAAAVNRQMEL